jgi:radical SAM protein with 4Fe4S-binding SPASM domain
LLTPALSDALIAAGLTRLVVSLQGTTEKKYKDISDAAIDMTAFVDNLRYFFMHKGKAKVYVKIIDCAIDGKDDEARFRSLFGDVCDSIAIEHAVPIHGGVDYDGVLKQEGTPVTQFGLPVKDVRVCPQPFFTMQVNPDGKVVPCYSFEYPGIMGDCRVQSLKEVWDSQVWRRFRCAMLKGVSHASGVCAHCNIIRYRLFPEDSLEGHEERLCKVYGC